MFCENCGHNIPDGAKFCPACGALADKADQSQNTYQAQTYEEPAAAAGESGTDGKSGIDGNRILSLIGPHKGLTAGCCMIWIGCALALFSAILNPVFYTISFGGLVTNGYYLSSTDVYIIMIVAIVAIAAVTIFNLYSVDVIGVMTLIITTCLAIGTGVTGGGDYTFSLEIGGVLMISAILTIAIGSVYGMMETMRNEDKCED